MDSNHLKYNNNQPITLSNCDKEPIHIIGSVQDQGFLLVVDEDFSIQHCSTNIERFLQYKYEEVIGKTALDIFPKFPGSFEDYREFGASEMLQFKEVYCDGKKKDHSFSAFHLCVHINIDGFLIIEAESVGDESFESYGQRIGNLFMIFSEQQDLYAVLDMVASEVKEVGGYSRVMIYEFDREYQGRVIIEKTDLESRFLGLHFPSTDIPVQARRLFVKNRFRLIEDVDNVPSMILPQTRNVDLTYSVLRASSPIHMQYLHNMGVKGSLTISIVVGTEKRLWGMIVSHNYKHRKNITFAQRKYCDMLGKVLSIQVENILQRKDLAQRINLETKLSVIRNNLTESETDIATPWSDILASLLPNLVDILDCDGAFFRHTDKSYKFGQLGEAADDIIKWIALSKAGEKTFISESVSNDLNIDCKDGLSCGVLYIYLTDDSGVYFFRNELLRNIIWAGEPKKIENNGVLNPRASFAQWKEIKKGRCVPWSMELIEFTLQIQSIVSRFVFRWTAEKLRDESEREKTIKEKLLREQEMIRQSALIHNNFLATVSHELRTPIHSILGNTERLTEMISINTKENDANQCCKMIQSSSEHLLAIISDILDLTKLESNKLQISPAPFDFYKKMESLIESFYSLASNKGLYIVALLPVGIPTIIADTTRLGQVILNFMSNAIKFTSVGGITLKVDLNERRNQENEVDLTFSVIDTGPGITDEDKKKLFERFYQLESGRARRFDGSGLGLAISKQLIALMDGTIGVDTKLGEGSTFWARITLKVPEKEASLRPYSELPYLDKNPILLTQSQPQSQTQSQMQPQSQSQSQTQTQPQIQIQIQSKPRAQSQSQPLSLSQSLSQPNALIFERRPYVRNFLSHYLKQYNFQITMYTDVLKTSNILYCAQNIKNLKIIFFELGNISNEEISGSIESFKQHFPDVIAITIDSNVSSKFDTKKCDGILYQPLSFIQLYSNINRNDGLLTSPKNKSTPVSTTPKIKLHILLAEDNKSNQYLACAFLKGLGHAVDVADNGLLAVRAFQSKFYDAILMDVMMPVMDGITATAQIRNYEKLTGKHVPIIALTAVSESTLVDECMKSGMDLCLFKPFKKHELEDVLNKASLIPTSTLNITTATTTATATATATK